MTRLCRNYRVCRTRPNYHWFRQNSVLYDLAAQGKSLQEKSVIRWFLVLHCASVLRITQGNWQHFKMATFRAGKLTRKKDWPFSINKQLARWKNKHGCNFYTEKDVHFRRKPAFLWWEENYPSSNTYPVVLLWRMQCILDRHLLIFQMDIENHTCLEPVSILHNVIVARIHSGHA